MTKTYSSYIDFYYNPASLITKDVTKELKIVFMKLADEIYLRPRPYIYRLPNDDPENCLEGGAYCANDPGIKILTKNLF
jgi:hypothetical protein